MHFLLSKRPFDLISELCPSCMAIPLVLFVSTSLLSIVFSPIYSDFHRDSSVVQSTVLFIFLTLVTSRRLFVSVAVMKHLDRKQLRGESSDRYSAALWETWEQFGAADHVTPSLKQRGNECRHVHLLGAQLDFSTLDRI